MPNRRTITALVSIAAVVGGLAVAAPVAADPRPPAPRVYAGVGSVVTANLWDVLSNGRAGLSGGAASVPSVASYDPTGTPTIQPDAALPAIPRPGSDGGIDALMAHPAQVDFARVPTRPRYEAGIADDRITYLPIARDAVSVAGFGLGYHVQNFTREDLTAIYGCTDSPRVTVTGSGSTATILFTGGAVPRAISPILPTGTGDVRAFFLRALGLAAPGACVATSPSFAENDARVLTSNGQIVPFLVSSWIAQKNGMLGPRTMNDYEHSILSINGERPLASTTEPAIPPLMPGPLYGRGAYPPGTQRGVFSRDVYNVVRSTDVATPLVATLTTELATPAARLVLNRTGFKNLDYIGQPYRFLPGPYPLD